MQRCNGRTKSGAPCRAPAGSGGLCFFHANPDKAQTLGQIGGRKNRAPLPEPPAAGSLSAGSLLDIIAETIYDVRAKRTGARIGGAIAQLSNSAHRILQTADLEARLARLEQQITELEGRKSLDTDATRSPGKGEGRSGTDADPGDGHTPGIGEEGKDGKA